MLPPRRSSAQMNLAWQWHDDSTAAVPNVELDAVQNIQPAKDLQNNSLALVLLTNGSGALIFVSEARFC